MRLSRKSGAGHRRRDLRSIPHRIMHTTRRLHVALHAWRTPKRGPSITTNQLTSYLVLIEDASARSRALRHSNKASSGSLGSQCYPRLRVRSVLGPFFSGLQASCNSPLKSLTRYTVAYPVLVARAELQMLQFNESTTTAAFPNLPCQLDRFHISHGRKRSQA